MCRMVTLAHPIRSISLSFTALTIMLSILLIGLFSLTTFNGVFRRLQKRELKKQFSSLGKLFFYRNVHSLFFPQHELESFFFINTLALNVIRFFFVFVSILLLVNLNLLGFGAYSPDHPSSFFIDWPSGVLSFIGLFLLFFIIGDYLPRVFAIKYPNIALKLTAFPASFFMLILFPLSFPILKASGLFAQTVYFDHLNQPYGEAKQEIIDMIQDSNVDNQLDAHDKKLFEAVMAFKDRIAREVMVPRVDVFSLSGETTIEECAHLILTEGYSRIPVYTNSLDNIVGVLMYKDILGKYLEYVAKGNDVSLLKAPVSTLIKNILYTPETKKISQLLQDFRKKQVHLAIIVDEYGGTEGIITIEDILEEIVGDISDEYDEEEPLFLSLPNGGWVLDARMSILDVEEQLGIHIPQEGDYDTVGGYVFHETGTIPEKGFLITKPDFQIEILRSEDRRVEKVRIQPLQNHDNENEMDEF
jgi:putative hemolysin